MSGTLYLVAVPIGNPDDLTLRARDTLRSVAIVAAEDTRHFATLARHHQVETRAVSYHDHNEVARARELLDLLRGGADVALVSDAGTPLVSDPGYRLVRAAIDAGIRISSLPGASAVTTALAASGLPPYPFRFVGFPPRTAGARRAFFAALRDDAATLVAFEAPHRLAATLRDALEAIGEDRPACLARSLTRSHERYQRGVLSELIALLDAEKEVRGEATLLIGGASGRVGGASGEESAGVLLRAGAPARAVQELLTSVHGMKRRDAYAMILRLQGKDR